MATSTSSASAAATSTPDAGSAGGSSASTAAAVAAPPPAIVSPVEMTASSSTSSQLAKASLPFRCCRCWRIKVTPHELDATLAQIIPGTQAGQQVSATSASSVVGQRHGVFTYPNGSVYEGQYSDRGRHGHGTLTLVDGTKYVAEWRNDARHGEGAEFCVDGTCFMGSYLNGLRNGHGVMTWPEGSKYSGQFERGKANGKGHLLRTDGSVYTGNFIDDCMSGEGKMEWKDGVEYSGQFVQNRREGIGKMKWITGRWKSYDGGWKDGKQHGSGTLVDQSEQVYRGLFQSGKLVTWDEPWRVQMCQAADAESLPESMVHVPSYWTNQAISVGFNERTEVADAFQEQIQKLLDGTFRPVRTRDRSGSVPNRLRLLKVHRVENSDMWLRYLKAKARVSGKRPDGVKPVHELDEAREGGTVPLATVRTQDALDDTHIEHLDSKINEFYLWHGTTPEGAIGISTDGFRLSYAGSHAGTYFGRGCYFAECSSKSDEYARAGDSIFAGVFALLLCRVTCGSLFRTTVPDHATIDKALATGDYDSVLGDREASVGTYREFVVYDEDLIYPEYVVLYERKFET